MGTWSFRARLGGNYARTCAHAAAGAGRPASAGAGPGSGSGLGAGSDSLAGLVLFEPGLTGMGYAEYTRSAIRIRTAPRNGCQPTAPGSWAVAAVETNCCNGSVRTVATVRLGSTFAPPGAL